MAVFLSVLQVIGIVLLSILGLAVVIVLLVLLLPVHYKVRAEFDKEKGFFKANAKVTYIAYMFHAEADADNSNFSYYLKFLGKKKIDSESDTDDDDEEEYAAYAGGTEKADILNEIEQAPEKKSEAVDGSFEGEAADKAAADAPQGDPRTEDPVLSEEEGDKAGYSGEEDAAGKEEAEKEKPRAGLKEKLGNLMEGIKRLYENTVYKLKNIGYTIEGVYDRINSAFKKVRYYKELLELEASKEAIEFGWKWLKYLLWHMRPRKIRGYLKLGQEDPADTGELLGLLCTLRPVCGRHFLVEPDFEREVLEGSFYMKGFLQLYVVAIVLAKYYFNKNFMRFVRRFRAARRIN